MWKVPTTPTTPAASASSHAAPAEPACALDGACAAACTSERLGPDLQDGVDQPVPDEDDDPKDPDGDVQMKDNSEPETEPDKNEEKP